jgi:hypothetical protein
MNDRVLSTIINKYTIDGDIGSRMSPETRASNDTSKEGEMKKGSRRACPESIDAVLTKNQQRVDQENEGTPLRLEKRLR